MKKLILFAAILFAGASVVNAQNVKPDYQSKGHESVTRGTKKSASTKLTVQLNSIQSISVNTSNVSLVYTTVEDYQQGVSSGVIPNHLEINSTGAYDVKVGYALDGDGDSDSHSSNDAKGYSADEMFKSIEVVVSRGDAPSGVAVAAKKLVKSADTGGIPEGNGPIINSTIGEFGAKFGVNYKGAADYINSIKGGNARTYTAQVTYTITPN